VPGHGELAVAPRLAAAYLIGVDMDQLAAFAARHAIALLLIGSLVLLIGAGIVWHLIERFMPRVFAAVTPLWHLVDRRQIAVRYLGWHVVISFAVAAVALGAFFEIEDELGSYEHLGRFDLRLAEGLGQSLSQETQRFFALLTHLGDFYFLTALVLVVAAVLFLRREFLLAWSWIVTTAGGGLLNDLLKSLFTRARPENPSEWIQVTGYSFPSGHAAGSMVVYGMLAYVIIRHAPRRWHLPFAAIAMLLIVFVGASRVLLRVHYFSDVVAGWMTAATWTALCVAGLEAWRLGQRRRVESGRALKQEGASDRG
jgi:membrane-associated phospholipid phosphatase